MSAKVVSNFTIGANLNNDSFASIIKMRPTYLAFDNGTDRYNIKLVNVDLRTWLSDAVTLSLQTVTLPNMALGKYKLALWLPDACVKQQLRPEYSIRFANNKLWNVTKGYNKLTDSLIITP